MSSERAGGLNRDWPGRADVFRSYGGELDQDMVDQLDRAHTPSERADMHTSGTLNREKAFERTERLAKILRTYAAAKLKEHEGGRIVYEADWVAKILEACVVSDPRLARIEALIEEPWVGSTPDGRAVRMGMRAILRGDQ